MLLASASLLLLASTSMAMALLASEFDQSKYLKAEGFEREKKFRIKAVAKEVFERDGKPDKKLVLEFTNDVKALILNTTNRRTLKGAFGDDTANWVGKVIVLFPMMADYRGKMIPGLRVRIPPPRQAATTAAPQQPAGNSAAAAPPLTPAAPQQPVASGNGAAVALPAAALVAAAVPLAVAALTAPDDPELDPDPVKPIGDDLDDEIGF